MPGQECNCPPDADVFRGRAGDTKPECPVHPTPPGLLDAIVPTPPGGGFRRERIVE